MSDVWDTPELIQDATGYEYRCNGHLHRVDGPSSEFTILGRHCVTFHYKGKLIYDSISNVLPSKKLLNTIPDSLKHAILVKVMERMGL